ncbi:glycosyltransferase 25 family member [Cephus cinctus]|uniref:Glycosyltransferase 25 family member n=1 Tax=Cephus cinctus TaxID=211228 RepID=A0AAJ7FTW9_CEPCN|nr:glycosyltransferase 25 family member [Cephus cinctus]
MQPMHQSRSPERMKMQTIVWLVFGVFAAWSVCVLGDSNTKEPTVLIGILVRNKAHTLPYFLTLLERLEYPTDRISLWIRSDNNIDNSIEILKTWLETQNERYHSVDLILDEESHGLSDEKGLADWTPSRFSHVIQLREQAVNHARKIWADFLFMLDADAFLTNPKTLKNLVKSNHTVVAPLLKSDGMYSNFWAGMTEDYYYVRTERYKPILNREEVGCLEVPMIHSAVLIDLRKSDSDFLTYKSDRLKFYDGPKDDIITFAIGANRSGIPLHICNDEVYGFVMVPLETRDTISQDHQQLTNLKLEVLSQQEPLPLSPLMAQYITYPEQDTLNMDNVYMINLVRRPDRRIRMQHCFRDLGIRAEIIDAVDGRTLNETSLLEWGVKMMPEYADPYHKRPMTMGEIGCFLSHYIVWNKMIENRYEKIMILEDDVRFEPYFRQKVNFILNELDRLNISWDLVYLGRKRMQEQEEPLVEGSQYLVYAGYSYWTVGYMLSKSGSEKLLKAKPLESMVPVDEYLPILFDKHPRVAWKKHFLERDLVALSAAPLLIYPTHYTGEQGYISDTEDSKVVHDAVTASKNREEF